MLNGLCNFSWKPVCIWNQRNANIIRKPWDIWGWLYRQKGYRWMRMRLRWWEIGAGRNEERTVGWITYLKYNNFLGWAIIINSLSVSIPRKQNHFQGQPRRMNHLCGKQNNNWHSKQSYWPSQWHQFLEILILRGLLLLRQMLLIMCLLEFCHSMMMEECYILWHIVQRNIYRLNRIMTYTIRSCWRVLRHLRSGDQSAKGLRISFGC